MGESALGRHPSTLEVLGLFVDQAPTATMLHVLTFRPEFEPPWPTCSHMTPLTLNRLERPQVEAMITRLARGNTLPAEVVEHIVTKTDGVPLFVEELTKMLLDSDLLQETAGHYELTGPLSSVAIPDTLQDSLRARLDQLNFDQALTDACQAIAVAEEVEATDIQAAGHFTTGFVHAVTGRLTEARREVDQTLGISRAAGDVTYQAFSFYLAGLLKTWEGAYDEAARLQADGLRIAQAHNLVALLLRLFFGYGVTLTSQGRYEAAHATLQEGLALSDKVGDEVYGLRLLNSLGWLYSECGDFHRALDVNRRGAEGARKRGDPKTSANAELNLGDIFLAQGNLALAYDCLDGVYRMATHPATSDWMKWRYSTHLFVSFGEYWLARGNLTKAAAFADQCLEIATRTTSCKYVVRGQRLRGEIALAQHQWEEAENWLRQALSLARTVGNPPQLWKSYLAIGQLQTETQQSQLARESYQAARNVIDHIKMTLQDSDLRMSLDHSPPIQQVYDLSAS